MPTSGVRVEEIARLVGHSGASTTDIVYRRELTPVLTIGAEIMDIIFATANTLTRQQPKARRHSPEKNHRLCRCEQVPSADPYADVNMPIRDQQCCDTRWPSAIERLLQHSFVLPRFIWSPFAPECTLES